jgi:hypothetical protein
LGIDRRTIDGEVIRFRFAGLPCLLAHAPLPMRVPAEVTNQVLAVVRNVLRHFGQEVQDAEDLEIALRSAS